MRHIVLEAFVLKAAVLKPSAPTVSVLKAFVLKAFILKTLYEGCFYIRVMTARIFALPEHYHGPGDTVMYTALSW